MQTSVAAARPISRAAWAVVALLFLGSVLNYIDRTVIAVVKPAIQQELGLNNEQYGLAVHCFLAAYTAFYILGGRLADLFGYRRMFSVNVIFWSAACMLHALTRGLASLCAFRGLLGIGEGGFYPTAIRASSEWFPPEERAKAVGILLCGLSVGSLIAPPFIGWVAYKWGWRTGFLVAGACGLPLVPLWMTLLRRAPAPAAATRTKGRTAVWPVLKSRKFLCFLSARAVTDVVWLFYLFWMPGYFQEVRGFDLLSVARLLWIPFLCADVGALGGAWASSGLVRRGWPLDRARKTVLLASAGLGAAGVAAPFVAAAPAALAIVSLVLLAQLSWSTNVHTTITEIAPPEHVAVLYGITGAAGNGLGALLQPFIGRAVDVFGYTPAFVATGVAYLAAIVCVLGAGRIEPASRSAA